MKDCKATKCLKIECIQIRQQDSQQDFQLFINDRAFASTFIFAFVFDFFCFDDHSLQHHSTSHRDRMTRSSIKKEEFS